MIACSCRFLHINMLYMMHDIAKFLYFPSLHNQSLMLNSKLDRIRASLEIRSCLQHKALSEVPAQVEMGLKKYLYYGLKAQQYEHDKAVKPHRGADKVKPNAKPYNLIFKAVLQHIKI